MIKDRYTLLSMHNSTSKINKTEQRSNLLSNAPSHLALLACINYSICWTNSKLKMMNMKTKPSRLCRQTPKELITRRGLVISWWLFFACIVAFFWSYHFRNTLWSNNKHSIGVYSEIALTNQKSITKFIDIQNILMMVRESNVSEGKWKNPGNLLCPQFNCELQPKN